MNYFSSDFHLGHNILVPKYRKQFNSQEEHDELILDKIAKLKKREILYILGDFIFDSSKYDYYINQLKKTSCRIKLVLGNHDSLKLYKEDRFEIQLPLFSYKNNWISHCPIHPQEMRDRDCNIHGHLHGGVVDDYRYKDSFNPYKTHHYYNVCLDNNNFEFVPFDKIVEDIKKLKGIK